MLSSGGEAADAAAQVPLSSDRRRSRYGHTTRPADHHHSHRSRDNHGIRGIRGRDDSRRNRDSHDRPSDGTTAAMADKLNHRRSVSLFVEDVERRQADIGDFLLTEGEVIRIIPWNIGNRTRR